MESDLGGFDSAFPYAGKNFRGEVKTSRGGRDGASLACIDGLISFAVFGIVFSINVRGQRHMAESLNYADEMLGGTEADSPLAKLATSDAYPLKLPCIAQRHLLSNLALPTWT